MAELRERLMRLHPFFSFFGSKFLAAPHYPVPRHPHIVEPFAGSACYALYYPQRQVTLIESDPVIAGVWRYLLTVSEAEILSLPDLQPGQRVSELAVAPEARSLIGYWLAKAQATPRQTPSAWMHRHPDSSFWGRRVRERIVRPEGESWKRAGVAWRAARLLLNTGRAVVYGTKYGWFTGSPWHFREVIVGTPEMDAHFAQHYPGCKIERSSRPRAVAKEKA